VTRKEIAARIIAGASIHRVAIRLIAEISKNTKWHKPIAAAKLAWIFDIPFQDAWSVIQEMDLTPSS